MNNTNKKAAYFATAKNFLFSSAVIALLGLFCPEALSNPIISSLDNLGEFVERECRFEIPKVVKRQVDCGFVTVPAFHDRPSSGTFELPVAIFRSNANKVKPDPLIYLHGGPGSSIFIKQVLNIYYNGLNLMASDRDIIMFDQRGTVAGKPEFLCEEYNEFLDRNRGKAINSSYVLTGRKIYTDCLRRTRNKVDIDLRAFNSLEHAKDVETIRQALNIEEWNIFGSSYGSKLGQVMLREYPNTIRSAILGSIVPLANNTILEQQNAFRAALNRTFALCAADPVCDRAYPDLKTVFETTVEELESEPIVLETADQEPFVIDGGRFVGAINGIYLGGTYVPSIPKVIYAVKNRDESFLRSIFGVSAPDKQNNTQNESNQNSTNSDRASNPSSDNPSSDNETTPQYNSSLRGPVFISYMCNEEVAFIPENEFVRQLYDYEPISEFYRAKPTNSAAVYDYCRQLNINEPIASSLNEPVQSNLPVLILNGGVDPITEPENAFEIASGLSNAEVVLFPSGTHGVSIANRCATSIANAFLNDPTQDLDTSCADKFEIGFTTDKITELTDFTLEAAGIRSVRPLNWVETRPGVFNRYITGNVVLSQTFLRGNEEQVLLTIAGLGGQTPTFQPSQIDTLQANGLNWTLYKLVRDNDTVNYIATAPAEQADKTYVVILTIKEEPQLHAYYYQEAFLPAVRAFEIISE